MLAGRALDLKLCVYDSLIQPGIILLPFLYSTCTIQRRPYTKVSRGVRSKPSLDYGSKERRPVIDRKERGLQTRERNVKPERDALSGIYDGQPKAQRRDRQRTDHVPFEKPEHEEKGEVDLDMEASTITPSEKKAFEKLFNLRKIMSGSKEQGEERNVQPSNRERERDSRKSRPFDLDALIESATSTGKRPRPQFPVALRPMAEQALARREATVTTTPANAQFNATPRQARDSAKELLIQHNLTRVNNLLNQARTDIALWQTLQTQVLNRVIALELDGPPASSDLKASAAAWHALVHQKREEALQNPAKVDKLEKGSISDLQILTANFPVHLLTFMTLIRTSFPASSHLGLALLPTLKKMGPSAFALGTTTELYDAHMHLLYVKFTDVPGIVDLFAEMDKEVYEFGAGTLGLLDRILGDAKKIRRGEEGEGVRALWGTEKMRRGLKALAVWRGVVEERRQEGALRKAREKESEASVHEQGGRAAFMAAA